MVQKSRFASITLQILGRIVLTLAAIGAGLFFFPVTIRNFVLSNLDYQIPSGFFGYTWADWDIAWLFSSSFLVGIILGTLGKKIDYVFIGILFLLCSLEFLSTENMTLLVYSGLVGATLAGNAIGFVLKLVRRRIWKQ